MSRFKEGDIVIALSTQSTNQPRVKGEKYTLNSVLFCNGCGTQWVNIGYKTIVKQGTCTECNKSNLSNGLLWSLSKYFVKIDNIESAIDDAIANEDYEFAQLLTEQFIKHKQDGKSNQVGIR